MAFKILLIEDDEFLRDVYKDELEKNGFLVDGFRTGGEGLGSLHQNQYDLVLLDIILPDINGLEVLRQIKQNPALSHIKVVLLTNLGQDTIIKDGFALGAEKFLIKSSYNPGQVVDEVKNVLGGLKNAENTSS